MPIIWPVIHVDSGPARNATTAATSSTVPTRDDRHVLVVAVEDRPARGDERHELGVDDARLHRVHADVVLAELVGRALHEHLDAGLARAVRAHEAVRRVAGDRRHPDDRAAAVAHHRRARVLDAQERADEVQVDGRAPRRRRRTRRSGRRAANRPRTRTARRAARSARPPAATARSTSASTVTSHTVYCTVTPSARRGVDLGDRVGEPGLGAARDRDVGAVGREPLRGDPSPMPLPPPVTSAVRPSVPTLLRRRRW